MEAVLADWRTAPVSEGMRATLGLLWKLTLDPDALGPADLDAVRVHGVSDEAIEDAAFVCALFNIYVRLADTFRFELPPSGGFQATARSLLTRGYAPRATAAPRGETH